MKNLFATPECHADYLNKKQAQYPTSSDFRDGDAASGHWYDVRNGALVQVEQVVGGSGVYLIETDYHTDEVVQDGRPWQMRA